MSGDAVLAMQLAEQGAVLERNDGKTEEFNAEHVFDAIGFDELEDNRRSDNNQCHFFAFQSIDWLIDWLW